MKQSKLYRLTDDSLHRFSTVLFLSGYCYLLSKIVIYVVPLFCSFLLFSVDARLNSNIRKREKKKTSVTLVETGDRSEYFLYIYLHHTRAGTLLFANRVNACTYALAFVTIFG